MGTDNRDDLIRDAVDQLAQSLDGDGEEVTVTVTLPRDQVDGVINLLALELDPPVGLIVES